MASKETLEIADATVHTNHLIITDSMSALEGIKQLYFRNTILSEIKEKLKKLGDEGKNMKFLSCGFLHTGIAGNEEADKATTEPVNNITREDLKLLIKDHINSLWQEKQNQSTRQLRDPKVTTKSTSAINVSWHDHVVTIAKTAFQKLGVLFCCRKLYTPEQLLLLYKAQDPTILLDSIQNKAVRLIDAPNLTEDLHSLEHRRRVAGDKPKVGLGCSSKQR
nr:unnamed protein product [Callosobruchus analis]